jgi:DNA-binding CsgD family transcriptional regulator
LKSSHDFNEEGMILTDESLKVIAADAGASAILKDGPLTAGRRELKFQLPDEVLSLLRAPRRCGERAAVKTTVFIRQEQYFCRAYTMEPQNGCLTGPVLALHLQRESSAATDAVGHVAALYDLTDREQEALVGIAKGLTSKEVAERMKISPNTVRAFVRLIMIKMGVTRRTAIISKLLEYNGQ